MQPSKKKWDGGWQDIPSKLYKSYEEKGFVVRQLEHRIQDTM